MSPPLRPPIHVRRRIVRWLMAGLAAWALLCALPLGCGVDREQLAARIAARFYPPEPQEPRVVALGTLRGAPPPSEAEVELALFLFGAEPPSPLMIANPTAIAADELSVLVCDNALDAILRWDAQTGEVAEACTPSPFRHPFAIDIAPDGHRLICDLRGVWRCTGVGVPTRSYVLPNAPYQPAGVVTIDGQVWVSNQARHTIEIFDYESGAHLDTLGGLGGGPGQFVMPRTMARTPDGNVCVVDLLNNRVQVLDRDGNFIRQIGQHGDSVGAFGRPKAVAVGPDGVIFVTDAFSQRVHAFAPDGRPLLAFGEPGSGLGELRVPNGIAISPHAPQTEYDITLEETPAYYVLVAEQLDQPGVRVYAWLGVDLAELPFAPPLPSGIALEWEPQFEGATAINPHWHPDRCRTCHAGTNENPQPISLDESDALCLTCHDGVQAPADPHPIGRPADTEIVETPDDWPTIDGAIGCLTCHDILRHCDRAAQRPAVNYVLLRGYDPQQPLEYCTICHNPDVGGRFSPHRQRDAQGRVREDACLFCHTIRPAVPEAGERQFEPHLRDETSDLCLNCHAPHWDLSPQGHVDRPVTPEIRQWMLMRELAREHEAQPTELARMARQLDRPPARLPLGDGMVTCYTCHNPHYTGLFPEDSELGSLADSPAERKAALRTDWIQLCSECHHH